MLPDFLPLPPPIHERIKVALLPKYSAHPPVPQPVIALAPGTMNFAWAPDTPSTVLVPLLASLPSGLHAAARGIS